MCANYSGGGVDPDGYIFMYLVFIYTLPSS